MIDIDSMLFMRDVIILSVLFVHPVRASSTFSPNCTLPSSIVNYVSSTSVRGTLDILWGSLFTILICTWTVQHLNVPEQTRDCSSWHEKLRETLKRGRVKLKWMLVTLIVPEFLVGKALQDLMMARKSLDQMRKFVEMDGTTWTLTHAFYANMGGFVLKIESSPALNPVSQVSPKDADCQIITLRPVSGHDDNQSVASSKHNVAVECHDNPVSASTLTNNDEEKAINGQSTVREEVAPAVEPSSATSQHVETEVPIATEILGPNAKSENTEYAYLNADQLYSLREDVVIAKLPDVPLKEIEDKSKGDAFVKGTAVTQVLWLVIQVIARGARRLPVSQIEIAAIAFAACTLLTYTFSWAKPQNVTVANLATKQAISKDQIKAMGNMQMENIQTGYNGASWSKSLIIRRKIDIFKPIPNDAEFDYLPGSTFFTWIDVGMVVAGTIFGSVHLIAWNFHFPTLIERLLWKLSAVYLAAALPVFYVFAFVFERLGLLKGFFSNSVPLSTFKNLVSKLMVSLPMLSYIVARLCLLVLVFRCLFFLEPEAFVTTWAKEVPHLQ
jgi:hypothetical protein